MVNKITAAMIKEIRERTGISLLECKKALVESQGNIELAIDNMRKLGKVKAAKKAGSVATKGSILTKITPNLKYGVIIEINCETDFVAKNFYFQAFCDVVINLAINERIMDIDTLKKQVENKRTELIVKVGENINIRRMGILEGDTLVSYLHNTHIGVIVSVINTDLVSTNDVTLVMKHVAMHIAASKPEYINVKDIPSDIVSHEKTIQRDIIRQSGKISPDITQKIIEGRMRKFFEEICLNEQLFVMDHSKTVGKFLCESGIQINNFIRFEVGEGINPKIPFNYQK
ncbi:Elongation factor Ts [Candidatus Mikella endobia]|uniref:Elongation factor Ts n=1 Tax=Candidatus Mikella endobia TaxID=1778264 RepID=A0A143WQG1_9ENTR|nr:translation elongation factor Ts [Candidatus Mikella endobia]CUX95968.1 Elongation factor Ts [Candidatus Mikella endobia]